MSQRIRLLKAPMDLTPTTKGPDGFNSGFQGVDKSSLRSLRPYSLEAGASKALLGL